MSVVAPTPPEDAEIKASAPAGVVKVTFGNTPGNCIFTITRRYIVTVLSTYGRVVPVLCAKTFALIAVKTTAAKRINSFFIVVNFEFC
jgi:hypothetical protein